MVKAEDLHDCHDRIKKSERMSQMEKEETVCSDQAKETTDLHVFRGEVVLTDNRACEVAIERGNRNVVGVEVTGIKEFKELWGQKVK